MKASASIFLVAACLATMAGPASATAISSAAFGNVTITLYDLKPDDGIAPSISFLPYTHKFDGGAYIHGEAETGQTRTWDPGSELITYEKTGAWQSTSVRDSGQSGMASSAASVTGSASGLGFTALSVSGTAESGEGEYGRYYSYASVTNGPNLKRFVLSANTMVTFSVDASVSASATLGYTPGAREGELAYAKLRMYAGGVDARGNSLDGDLQEHLANVLYGDGWPAGGASNSWSGLMSASFSNLSDRSGQGEFYAEATVGGRSVPAAVPEPSSPAILLSGLGLMAALARRRRSHGN